MSRNILCLENVRAGYDGQPVIRNINLSLNEGDILAVAGESGSGKSTLLRAILPVERKNVRIMSGEIKYRGNGLDSLSLKEQKALAGSHIGMIFQNPAASFNPVRSYKKQFREVLKSHSLWQGPASLADVCQLLAKMGLENASRLLDQCPCEMSGGMNQRMAIALSLLLEPDLLLADEPTSALDVTVQSQVIRDLKHVLKERKTTAVIVTHDLGVAAYISDQVAILMQGKIIEFGDTRTVLQEPKEAYTKALLAAVPKLPDFYQRGCR